MKIRYIIYGVLITLLIPLFSIFAQDSKLIKLPPPNMQGQVSLTQALKDRKSTRQFGSKELPLQIISDMLWAASGINRPESGLRTAPSAMNMQEIDIYLAKADGLYLYDASANALIRLSTQDFRSLTGKQPFVKDAPINLIYVVNLDKMNKVSAGDRDFYAALDSGFISQNVYLYCASVGLATVVRGSIDRLVLAKAMKLSQNQKILLAQTVGYPN